METPAIVVICIILPATLLWHLIITRLSNRIGLVKLNYAKKPIMASYGVISFAYVAAVVTALTVIGCADWQHTRLYLAVMGAMWALGVIDDIFGSREVGGFKGHFKKLLFERKLTTGAIKAIGGGIVGIATGWSVSRGDILRWIAAAMLVPLAANTLNLLDLRPGRAVAVFFFILGVTCIVTHGSLAASCIIGAVAVVALAWGIVDSRGRAMMGDSGSNALGAALGLTIALNTGLAYQLGVCMLFVVIQLYSEKYSISGLIERNMILRAIDRRLGVR